jgi:hypothetical protein|tara:strand:+ start:263 stop:763 length:501 start_codon:yes stop_codon:yes gene_type:complete
VVRISHLPHSASLIAHTRLTLFFTISGENQKKALCITGPNMGGKSVFVRQTALLVLMAQIGSFVPAVAMRLTAFNGVHTRMGASDNLATGSSTFLEEMAECAGILAAVKTEAKVRISQPRSRRLFAHTRLTLSFIYLSPSSSWTNSAEARRRTTASPWRTQRWSTC